MVISRKKIKVKRRDASWLFSALPRTRITFCTEEKPYPSMTWSRTERIVTGHIGLRLRAERMGGLGGKDGTYRLLDGLQDSS